MRVRIKVPGPAGPRVAKLAVPDGCTLAELGTAVAVEVLHADPSLPVVLSFNNKDPLAAPAADTPVRELGVCSGDLLWLLEPAGLDAVTDPPAVTTAAAASSVSGGLAGTAGPNDAAAGGAKRARGASPPDGQQAVQAQQAQPPLQQPEGQGQGQVAAADRGKQPMAADEGRQAATAGEVQAEHMAVDGAEEGAVHEGMEVPAHAEPVPPSQRVPAYLLRTLQRNCSAGSQPPELLLLAAHAAMLETGFVPTWAEPAPSGGSSSDSSSSSTYQLPASTRVSSSFYKLQYHLLPSNGDTGSSSMDQEPAAAAAAAADAGSQPDQARAAPACTLQCSSMGGSVVLAVATQSHARHLALHAATYVQPYNAAAAAVAAPGGAPPDASVISSNGAGGSSTVMQEGDATGAGACSSNDVQLLPGGGILVGGRLHLEPGAVKQLWTRLKDGLAFPMLLAAYAEAGLQPPAGLLALPEDLKQRLLLELGPQDLAAVCGACSELRHLASQDELWKPLFEREFPHAASYFKTQAQHRGYKWAFGQCWRERRQREEALRRARHRAYVPVVPRFGVPRPPFYPPPPGPGFPGTIGGDYDRFPQFGPGSGLPGQFGGGMGIAPGGGFAFGGGRRQGRGGPFGFRMH